MEVIILHRAHQHQLIGSVVLPPYLLFCYYALKASHLTFLSQLFLLFLVFPEIGDLLVIVDQLVVEVSLHILGEGPKIFLLFFKNIFAPFA